MLAIALALCLFNVMAVWREHSARNATDHAFESARASESIRFQMMQNRQLLSNYLLSGSSGDLASLTEGLAKLQEQIRATTEKQVTDQQKSALTKLSEAEREWENNFARPLIDKRKQVDSGNATVSELQIQYLQLDPATWTTKSTGHLDDMERLVKEDLELQRKDNASASNWSLVMGVLLGIIGLAAGVFIAWKTSNSIIEPLTRLMKVSKEIGETGDLDHQIDIQRSDEIGELAVTFSSMVSYLKEMSGVSEAIARGDLSVQVRPRS
jgi:methyl-accepting chemotaxis protein